MKLLNIDRRHGFWRYRSLKSSQKNTHHMEYRQSNTIDATKQFHFTTNVGRLRQSFEMTDVTKLAM